MDAPRENLTRSVSFQLERAAAEELCQLLGGLPQDYDILAGGIPVNRKTGMQANPGDPDTIMEAFKPGTAPPERDVSRPAAAAAP